MQILHNNLMVRLRRHIAMDGYSLPESSSSIRVKSPYVRIVVVLEGIAHLAVEQVLSVPQRITQGAME